MFGAREGVEVEGKSPVWRLERGRGYWWCVDGGNTPSRVSSEGGSMGEKPLRLAFQAREGSGGVSTGENTPSVSRFERGRG